ncbi:MAG: hypothetical protein CBC79_00455 [Gammaproteobacteria bacterium TMED119]|nr:MAG: hypothetical protein CBC79_00455 [Gammaproteobacteria bacterium TMED119]|tara:strand:- start:750 stop:1190 length:441 start_codon:yes stop_codon:yes gene_type:complete
MFSKKKVKSTQIDTLIGHDTTVTGDIHFSSGLHIEGTLNGNLIADDHDKAVLIISEQGVINGDVNASVVIINGKVKGNVSSSTTLEMAQHAKVTGNVHYNLLEMEVGAEVNGSLNHVAAGQHKATQSPSNRNPADDVDSSNNPLTG